MDNNLSLDKEVLSSIGTMVVIAYEASLLSKEFTMHFAIDALKTEENFIKVMSIMADSNLIVPFVPVIRLTEKGKLLARVLIAKHSKINLREEDKELLEKTIGCDGDCDNCGKKRNLH